MRLITLTIVHSGIDIMTAIRTLFYWGCATLTMYSGAQAQEVITPADLYEFGWEYVGETVQMFAVLNSVYACRQPSNQGKICTSTEYNGRSYDDSIFADGIRSRQVRPLIGKCILMIGDVVDADITIQGSMVSAPALEIESFETVDDPFCG